MVLCTLFAVLCVGRCNQRYGGDMRRQRFLTLVWPGPRRMVVPITQGLVPVPNGFRAHLAACTAGGDVCVLGSSTLYTRYSVSAELELSEILPSLF